MLAKANDGPATVEAHTFGVALTAALDKANARLPQRVTTPGISGILAITHETRVPSSSTTPPNRPTRCAGGVERVTP